MIHKQLSRRRLLQTTGAAVLSGAVASTVEQDLSPATVQAAPLLGTRLKISKDPNLHAIRRLTFGPTPELFAHVQAIGVDAFIEEQLSPESIDDSALDAMLTAFPTLSWSNAEIFERSPLSVARKELQQATIVRALHSKRQFYELMVDFWGNHFSMYIGDGNLKGYKTTDDREVIRPYALGRFADMLKASAQSPAMLHYLDNRISKGDDPNENYARELLELHTLGVDGGYTEEDVRNAAYCLTGWSVKDHQFEYRDSWHYTEPLNILEWRTDGMSGPDSMQDGLSFLDYLAHHPKTSKFLAEKLCRRFLDDDPPKGLVRRVAKTYLDNDTEIKPMLREIFKSQAFRERGKMVGQKFRRPFEFMVATLRAVDAQIQDDKLTNAMNYLHSRLIGMGQGLFEWHPPNGYPDVMGAWANTDGLLARWNFLQEFMNGNRDGTRVKSGIAIDFPALTGDPLPQTAREMIDQLAHRLIMQDVSREDRKILLAYLVLRGRDAITETDLRYKAPQLVALLINSPYFQFR